MLGFPGVHSQTAIKEASAQAGAESRDAPSGAPPKHADAGLPGAEGLQPPL